MISVLCNGETIENNMGFPVAMDMARLLSLSWNDEKYEVAEENGCVLVAYKNGERAEG